MEEQMHEPQSVPEQTSLFSYLHNLRLDRGIERERLAQALGIPARLIEAIETQARDQLPGDVYLLGIAKKYAVYFKVPYGDMERLWRAETEHARSGRGDRLPQNRFRPPLRSWSLSLRTSAGILFFGLAFLYLGVQLVSALMPVRIRMDALPTVSAQETIVISGSVRGRARALLVNSRPVRVEDQRFHSEVLLAPGPNSIRVVAENYAGASTTLERIVVFQK